MPFSPTETSLVLLLIKPIVTGKKEHWLVRLQCRDKGEVKEALSFNEDEGLFASEQA